MSTTTTDQTAVRYDRDADGIVTLTLDDPTASANTMNELYVDSMAAAVDRLYDEAAQDEGSVTGVVVASAKKTFFAGANLNEMVKAGPADAPRVFELAERVKASLRRLETFPKPVVAAINGAALGGGFEIALACNHRVAVDGGFEVGLPEASLGLLPGGGGVTRIIRLLGIQSGLMDVLLQGSTFKPAAAKEKGLVDELVPTQDELVPAAKAWIKANPDAVQNPWDAPGYKMPGGSPKSPAMAGFLPAFPALLRKQLKGADYPAQKAILSAAVEGAQVDFDTASRIESRYLTSLVVNQGSKNMIQAFFFDLQAINSGSLRPQGIEPWKATKVGVLGAGMMGAGIAYVCARAGMEVVLKDVAVENAEKGKSYSEKLLDKAISRGRSTEEKKAELLGRIKATADPADLVGCDLVIEAVFEDPALKEKVFAEILPHVNPDALLCSNTSTLPITELATGVDRPNGPKIQNFIGLHFFSPVDKMPLVEIIKGEQTSDVALAKAYDVVQQIRKTPIVVNDSRGFYTSRVIGFMVNEGMAMLAEGVHPYSIERATTQAGYPAPVLQLSDELNLELMVKIAKAAKDAGGPSYVGHPGSTVVDKMLEAGRAGRLRGAGFYDYDESGTRGSIWPGLGELFPVAKEQIPFRDIKDRMLFAEALETAKCFEEGVIESAAAANIGSIMGIGFPPMTGGAAQFMTGYQDPENPDGPIGLAAFLERADELAATYGDRFQATPWLRDLAAKGEGFPV